ncbi:MAG: hypothetical protein Tsb004_15380 [Allomuricauda sp.]
MKGSLKDITKLIAGSTVPLIATLVFMKLISLNLSYAFIVSIIALAVVSFWVSKWELSKYASACVVPLPLSIGYYILILPEIPGLWVAIPFFFLLTISVFVIRKKLIVTLILAMAIVLGIFSIPSIVAHNLTQTLTQESPKFTLKNILNESEITNESLQGKVVILDFFGTWCAPCIKEMAALEAIKKELDPEPYVFLLACTDEGGDTPRKARAFYNKRSLSFNLFFDFDSKVHESFGFTGVPSLVILDKRGRIRVKHEGYNEAEDLKANLLPILKQLADE